MRSETCGRYGVFSGQSDLGIKADLLRWLPANLIYVCAFIEILTGYHLTHFTFSGSGFNQCYLTET
jgi:hypothetical protein